MGATLCVVGAQICVVGTALCIVGAALCVVGVASCLTSCNTCSLKGLIRGTKGCGIQRSMKQLLSLVLKSALCR